MKRLFHNPHYIYLYVIIIGMSVLSTILLFGSVMEKFGWNDTAGTYHGLLSLRGMVVSVEIADTPQKRMKGLSERESIPINSGMFFVFSKDDRHAIWMRGMRFPIDIVWLDRDLKVVDQKWDISPNTYPSQFVPVVAARYVLELPSGGAKRLRISLGDVLSWTETPKILQVAE